MGGLAGDATMTFREVIPSTLRPVGSVIMYDALSGGVASG
jgi:hypothetical protein